ncbi:hypothetical protein Sjap_015111 [Stephania japonica]|uniref:Uncharacterized protein n=1 Tax=Stephania japonica TaxID=461633 RepID=A0AAP0III5_9MAGN
MKPASNGKDYMRSEIMQFHSSNFEKVNSIDQLIAAETKGEHFHPISTLSLLNKGVDSIISITFDPLEKQSNVPTRYIIFAIFPCIKESFSPTTSETHQSSTEMSSSSTCETPIEEESQRKCKGKEVVATEETEEIILHTPILSTRTTKRKASLTKDDSNKLQKHDKID